jgi:mannose-6-phosphate isomerase-like protein (cupin superfamily)
MRPKIAALEQAMRQQTPEQLQDFLDQIEMRHFYADGMYCRWCKRAKGVVIVGKVHKKEHLYIVAAGSVAVTNGDDAPVTYFAGDVVVSRPGTKRAVVALEDSICMTVHRTDKTDLDEIEEEIIEPDSLALFDSRNKLKVLK